MSQSEHDQNPGSYRKCVHSKGRTIPKFYESVEVGVKSKHTKNLETEKLMKIEGYKMIDSMKVLHDFRG